MARPDGVVIASERFWAFARRDGAVLEGAMPTAPRFARSIPLVRGLVRLSASVSPLFRGTGITRRRERLLLTAALLAPCAFVLLSSTASVVGGLVLTGTLLAWLLRGRTLYRHGAEHRAIAAAENGTLAATWHGDERPSRFSLRCGTNFVALVLPVGILADRMWPFPQAFWTPILLAALTLGVSMELWRAVQGSARRGARLFLLPGLALQRLTTREPELAETRLALTAVASVLRRELA
ncbi:MAG TPA: DUF1385 domain-containing protein [Gaiellaceae bacterium]|nr:DUF1385 domain-containing protein [Gaiellaceae bacterium]